MNNLRRNKIAFVDIDGTIVRGQSQQILVKYLFSVGEISVAHLISIYTWFFIYKIGFPLNPESILRRSVNFLTGKSSSSIETIIDGFILNRLSLYLYDKASDFIDKLHADGYQIVFLSSALSPLVKRLARYLDVDDYISNCAEIKDGFYTGRIAGSVIYGKTKIDAANDYIRGNNFDEDNVCVYADHVSDLPLLSRFKCAYAVNPARKMKRLAKGRNIGIIYLN